MSKLNVKNIQSSLQQMLQNDPRKAGVLGALLLVLGFMVVRVAVSKAQAPNAAHASHPRMRVENALSADMASAAGGVGLESTPVTQWLEKPALKVSRNLFAVRYEAYPLETAKSPVAGGESGFWDEIAKSMADQDDQQERKQELLQNLQALARELQVTSVMMGPTPRAVIDGKLVGEGDVVADFRVLKIEARRIIVERAGIRLEITMN